MGRLVRSVCIQFVYWGYIPAILTEYYGISKGADTNQIYLFDDIHNIFLYAVVCPLYVSAAIFIFVNSVYTWSSLHEYVDEISENKRKISPIRLVGTILFILVAALMFTTNYIGDLTDPKTTQELYWFVNQSSDDQRFITNVGA